MKKIFLVLMLISAVIANAQIKVVVPAYSQVQVARSAGDSSLSDVSIGFTGNNASIFPNQIPDSIYIESYNNADSIAVAFRIRATVGGSGVYSNTGLDSIVSSVGVATNKVFKIPQTAYNGFDKFNIALTASNVAANAASATNAAKLTARLVFFYKAIVYRP